MRLVNIISKLLAWRNLDNSAPAMLAFLLAAPIVGYAAAFTAIASSAKPALAFACPAGLLLAFLYLTNKWALLTAIILVRGGLDPLLETTKLTIGGVNIGFGAVLNGVILLLSFSIWREVKPRGLTAISKWAIPFGCIVLLNTLRSPTPVEAAKLTLGLCTYAAMFCMGFTISLDKGAKHTFELIIRASAIAIALSFLYLISGWNTSSAGALAGEFPGVSGRFSGSFSHPNIMAFFFVTTTVACLYLLRAKALARGRLFIFIVMALSLGMIVASQTRAAWAAIALTLFSYCLLFDRRLLLWLCIGSVVVWFVPAVQERMLDLVDQRSYLIYSTLNSYDWRKQIWADGIHSMPLLSWIFGNGIQSFFYDSKNFFSLSGGNSYGAHSVFVQLLYETGLIGVSSLALFSIKAAHFLCRNFLLGSFPAFVGLCLIAAYAITCYSDNVFSYLVYNIYFWLAMGAIACQVLAGREDRNGSAPLPSGSLSRTSRIASEP